MELVSTEIDGTYNYCAKRNIYVKVNTKGDEVGVLPADFVPDPVKLWSSKAISAGFVEEDGTINYNDDRVLMLKPTQTVFKIWEHKNANANA